MDDGSGQGNIDSSGSGDSNTPPADPFGISGAAGTLGDALTMFGQALGGNLVYIAAGLGILIVLMVLKR